jgi:hypothetical protein
MGLKPALATYQDPVSKKQELRIYSSMVDHLPSIGKILGLISNTTQK